MALTQAIGPDEAIKLLEMCDMSKHAQKLVSSKGNPDGPLPKWGEPPVDAMNKTPGQKKKKKEVEEDCWDGYKKVGMKKKGKKRVPNCVPTNEEIKTIKVGEDAVGASNPHYVIVKDRKVVDTGTKEDMMKKCGKDERVWLSTKKVGDVVEQAELVHLLRLIPEGSAQDPDIKDREGTQPAAYHKGLKKTTKAKRDAHFKKHGKKADDDASAYKDAPGDKKARKKDMPKSKYTKFVDKMMDEEHEIHVKLDHLDGDSRQKKAGAVMRKHERAGHIEYVGNTDKGVVFKAKTKDHANRLHKDLKPHATGVEHTNEETQITEISKDTARSYFNKVGNKSKKEIEKRKAKGGPQRAMKTMYPEAMSPESQKAHRNMFKAAQKKKDDSAAQAEREKRLKAKGWVKNDRGGMSKVSEAKYAVDIEGMPRFYMDSDSPGRVKVALRQMLKKANAIKNVKRTFDPQIKADLRARLKDASTDMQTNYVSEKLKASDDMGKWVDDFKDSDAPQFKGKSMKKRRQMAIAAKLSAMREGTDAYGKSVNKIADDKKKASISSSDKNKLGKIAAMMAKERQMKEDVEQVDEAAEYHVTRPGGSLKKPDSVHKSKTDAMKAAYRLSGNKHRGAHGGQVYRVHKGTVSHGFDTEGRKRHLGLDHDKVTGKKPIGEAMGDAAHKAAVKHITDLGKKNKKSFGQQRMHIDNNPGKHDEKTRQAAKTINKNQFGNWKKGKDGKVTQEEAQKKDHQTISYVTHGGQKGKVQVHKDNAFKALNHYRKNNKSAQFEETGSWKKDSGWRKAPAERKDEYGNTIKKQNLAKHLAKKAMNKTAEKKS